MQNNVSIKNAAFIHPSVLMFGNITLAQGVSIWPYAVIRADRARSQIVGLHKSHASC